MPHYSCCSSRFSSVCLRLRLCPKASLYTEEKGSRDDTCTGIYLECSDRDGITVVWILLTSSFTFSVMWQHHRPLTSPLFHPPCAPSHHHLPHHPPTFFYPSSISVCSSLQNVMRQASRRKHGSGVCWGGLLLSGKYVLIKKNKKKPSIVSVLEGVLAGWHGCWVDGWADWL